jgi:hypothetical protein
VGDGFRDCFCRFLFCCVYQFASSLLPGWGKTFSLHFPVITLRCEDLINWICQFYTWDFLFFFPRLKGKEQLRLSMVGWLHKTHFSMFISIKNHYFKGFVFGCYELTVFLTSPLFGKYVIFQQNLYKCQNLTIGFCYCCIIVGQVNTQIYAQWRSGCHWRLFNFVWVRNPNYINHQ